MKFDEVVLKMELLWSGFVYATEVFSVVVVVVYHKIKGKCYCEPTSEILGFTSVFWDLTISCDITGKKR